MDKGWHTYWRNPGDSGGPIEIDWDLPKGFSVSDIKWPLPERLSTPFNDLWVRRFCHLSNVFINSC